MTDAAKTWWCIGEDVASTQELAGHPTDYGIDPTHCEQARSAELAYRKHLRRLTATPRRVGRPTTYPYLVDPLKVPCEAADVHRMRSGHQTAARRYGYRVETRYDKRAGILVVRRLP
jgi:hypothetical protein